MKVNSNPQSLIPNPQHLCLHLFLMLAMLFAFSCSNTETNDLPPPEIYSSSEDSQNFSSSSTVSATRCKDSSNRDYYCQWSNGSCWAIDPEFSETSGATCNTEINACENYGSLYINSTTEGENTSCSGGEWSTRCRDSSNRDYYCQWTSGCYAIDPTFAKASKVTEVTSASGTISATFLSSSSTSSSTCSSEIKECQTYGLLYINSNVEGEDTSCSGGEWVK